jgi:hypothetical protein
VRRTDDESCAVRLGLVQKIFGSFFQKELLSFLASELSAGTATTRLF